MRTLLTGNTQFHEFIAQPKTSNRRRQSNQTPPNHLLLEAHMLAGLCCS